MKKIVSIILMLAMTLSMFSSVSAATIADKTSYVPNPMDLLLSVTAGARLSGSDSDFVYPPEESVSFTVGAYEKEGVDYKAKLNMGPVRALFGEGYIQNSLPNDAEAMAEFNNGTVTTTVNVLVEYPSAAIIAADVDLASASVGVLDAGSIFSESAREVNDNTVKITYVNTAGLKASELAANVDSYLKDIEFTLNDVIAYSEAGSHLVKITLSGETLLDFASKDQRVVYSGSASTVVNVSKEAHTGGGGGASSFAVSFKTNGGTSVDGISVIYGKTIEAPVSTRKGYVLEGWYTDADLTKKFDFATPITHGMTLYAKWVEASCMGELGNGCPSLKYGDVDTSAWYHKAVDYALDYGLMVGVADGVFAPNGNLTRGMLVTVLGRREGIKDTDVVAKTFDDVETDIYYASHIDWAEKNNIVKGYGDGNFGPNDFITREQMAAIIHRYITFKNLEIEGEIRDTAYADNDSISDWAKESVTFCYSKGIMQGKDGNNFDPLGNATRAEFATVMMRTFK